MWERILHNELVVGLATNIGGGLLAAVIYDWLKAKLSRSDGGRYGGSGGGGGATLGSPSRAPQMPAGGGSIWLLVVLLAPLVAIYFLSRPVPTDIAEFSARVRAAWIAVSVATFLCSAAFFVWVFRLVRRSRQSQGQ